MDFLLVLFWIVCALIVAVVLVQSGKGTGFAGAFGSGGGSQTAFGARAGSFLTRLTAGLAATFMVLSFLLVMIGSRVTGGGSAPDAVATPDESSAKQSADWVEKSGVADDVSGTATSDKSAPAKTSTASPTETAPAATDNAAAGSAAAPADKSAPAETSTAPSTETGSAGTKPAESAPVQPQ